MAALSWPFSSQDVLNQFHGDLAMSHNVQNMYNQIFDDAWGLGDSLQDFDGTGRGEADTLAPQQVGCSGGNVTVRMRGDVTFLGTQGFEYRFKYDTSFDFPSPGFTSWTSTSSTGTKTEDVSGFSIGDDVYVKIQWRNRYTWDSSTSTGSHDETVDSENVTTTKSALATPSIITKGTNDLDVYLEFSHDSNSTDAQYEYRVNGGTAKTPDSINCEQDLGTATAEVNFRMDGFLNPGDTLEARVRASGNACYNASAWSSWTSVGRPEDYKSCANF